MITIDLNKVKTGLNDKVLDVGCGSGRHIVAIYENVQARIVGLDLSFDKIKKAKERLFSQNKFWHRDLCNVEVCVGNILKLPFSNDFFDFIICSEVLEHLLETKMAVKELVRVLKPGKTLVISVPRFLPEKICWILSKEYAGGDTQHVKIYRKRELIALLETVGLECYDLHYSHSLHTPFWLLKCLIGLNRKDSFIVKKYHDFLIWHIMKKPKLTRFLEKIFNPLWGKSLVLYLRKTI